MEAISFTRWDKHLKLINKNIPKIEHPDEVFIKIAFSGISPRDVSIISGHHVCNRSEAFILGHQICGIVGDVGADVMSLKKKDKVVIDPYTNCGICLCCRSGKPHLCHMGCAHSTLGIFKDGGWAEYIVVSQTQVYKIPDGVTLEQAALTKPMTYVSHGFTKIAPVRIDERILIIGAGLTGLLWIIMFHHHGHRNVVVSEPNLARHEFIQQLDIKYEIISPKIASERQDSDPRFKFDVIVDCSGGARVMEEAVKLLEYRGRLCIVGTAKPTDIVNISPLDIQQYERKIVGIELGSFNFPKALTHLQSLGDKYISFYHLGVKTYALKDFKNAIDHVKKGSVIKAVFKMPDDCKCSRLG